MKSQLKKWLTTICLSFASAAMVFGFQNCGEFKVDASQLSQFGSLGNAPSAGGVLVPLTDKTDPTCLTNPAYDACLIKQNPVASSSAALSTDPVARRTQLSNQSLYGVKLTSLAGSGKLENATINVQSLATPLATTTAASLKALPGVVGSSNFEQVNTYYWVNRAAEYFDARTNGALPAKGKGVTIVVDDTITGYETKTNTIRLKSTEASGSVAWSGDVAVHMFGIANLMLANPTGWTTLSAARHATRDSLDKGYCTALAGCANAIRFGVGEYFAASMFPDRTQIGAALANTGNAQLIATVARDVAALSTNTAQALFTASTGNAQAMGVLYAAIWWQVRAAAGTDNSEIDRIFLEHLALLDGNDDFRTAIAKAKTVDSRLFGGRHSAKFDSQLTARGL